jgi:hypothetical protein
VAFKHLLLNEEGAERKENESWYTDVGRLFNVGVPLFNVVVQSFNDQEMIFPPMSEEEYT